MASTRITRLPLLGTFTATVIATASLVSPGAHAEDPGEAATNALLRAIGNAVMQENRRKVDEAVYGVGDQRSQEVLRRSQVGDIVRQGVEDLSGVRGMGNGQKRSGTPAGDYALYGLARLASVAADVTLGAAAAKVDDPTLRRVAGDYGLRNATREMIEEAAGVNEVERTRRPRP